MPSFIMPMPNEANRRLDPDYSKDFNVLGKTGLTRKDGYEKATGRAVYSLDWEFPGTLYARMLTSPHANATIKSMDTSKAAAFPGVRHIIRYDDPDLTMSEKITAFPSHAYFEGDVLGCAVVADTDEIAQEAIRLVDVEWDVLPFVLTCEEGLADGAPLVINPRSGYPMYPDSNLMTAPTAFYAGHDKTGQKRGDVQIGFSEADQIIEFTNSRAQNNGAVEPHTISMVWKNDIYEFVAHSQLAPNFAMSIAKPFGVSQAAGHQHPVYNGGSFGTGCVMAVLLYYITAAISRRIKRPVKALLDLQQSYYYCVGNDTGLDHFKVGFNNDGTIIAVQNDTEYNGTTFETASSHIYYATSIPNILCNYRASYTNRPTLTAYRSEQRCACHAMCLITNHVAAALDMDPTEVALKNDGAFGNDKEFLSQFKADHGFPNRDSLKECIEAAKEAIDFNNVWHKAGTKKLSDGRMHGIGFTWDFEWKDTSCHSACAVIVRMDGTAQIISHHQDIGCNSASTYCQIAAEELGLKYEDCFFKENCEGNGLAFYQPGASAGTVTNSWSLKRACQQVKAQMLETATQGIPESIYHTYNYPPEIPAREPLFPGLQPEDLDIKNGIIFEKANPDNKHSVEELLAQVHSGPSQAKKLQGDFFAYGYNNQGAFGCDWPHRCVMCRQAHFTEVAVDTETGEVEIIRSVVCNDVGKALSPETVKAQQYGGAIMGLSRGKFEECVYDPSTGIMLNGNILDYKVATMRDCGTFDVHTVETALGYGAYGTVGVGEDNSDTMTPILAPAIYNAIGQWIEDFPITPDKVLKALGKV